MKKLNFALIGCGRIAQRHAEHIHNLAVLKAVCDIDSTKADQMDGKYGATAYTNLDTLLEQEKQVEVSKNCSPKHRDWR